MRDVLGDDASSLATIHRWLLNVNEVDYPLKTSTALDVSFRHVQQIADIL